MNRLEAATLNPGDAILVRWGYRGGTQYAVVTRPITHGRDMEVRKWRVRSQSFTRPTLIAPVDVLRLKPLPQCAVEQLRREQADAPTPTHSPARDA